MKKIMFVLSLIVCVCAAGAAFSAEGKDLFAKCQGCHGADGSKSGLSKPLKGMSEADALKALMGYKAGSFGGEKKAMMEGQVKSLSEDDLKALAAFIAKL